MKEFWDERFGVEEYAYGIHPNEFFKQSLDGLTPGKIFLPAEGEGRNAVYAARQGWDVTALDYSVKGREKALRLAERSQVMIDYRVGSLFDFSAADAFDAVGLVFLHFPPAERKMVHAGLIRSLKPGGYIIAELFHKNQIRNSSGGPPNIELLYSVEDIRSDFSSLHIEQLEHKTIMLDEGPFHQGSADVVRLLAMKPV
jgi:SAM-dependent methyltransferase